MAEIRVAALSSAQRRVVAELACDGASNAAIAERLGLSVDTVKSHVKAALQASGCHDRTELAVALVRRRVLLKAD